MRVETGPSSAGIASPPRQRTLSLRANFSWTFVGNVIYAACQWGIMVALAKLARPEVVGQFALGVAVTAPVIMFTNLNLRTVQATDAREDFTFGDYFAHRLIATVLGFITVITLAGGAGYSAETAWVIVLVGAAKCFESLSDICYGLAQSRERMDSVASSMVIKGLLSLLLVAIAAHLTGSALWASAALAAAWAAVFACYDLRIVRHFAPGEKNGRAFPRWDPPTFWRLTRLALPLGLGMLLLSLYFNIPRYFLERYRGEYQLGIFAAMAYVMAAGMTVVQALGQSASPRLARLYAEGARRDFFVLLSKIAGVAILLGLAGIAVGVFFGRQVLTLLYSSEYAVEGESFVWVMAASAVAYVTNFLGYGICAARAFYRQLLPFAMVVLITALCSWSWVPEYGIKGAAWAFLAASTANLFLFVEVLRTLPPRASEVNP